MYRQLVEQMGGGLGLDTDSEGGFDLWFEVPMAPPGALCDADVDCASGERCIAGQCGHGRLLTRPLSRGYCRN